MKPLKTLKLKVLDYRPHCLLCLKDENSTDFAANTGNSSIHLNQIDKGWTINHLGGGVG